MNNISFQHTSLRETVIQAIDYIGVDIDDFDLKESYFNNGGRYQHDARHLYRVMINCALIALSTNDSRRGLLAFCGGYIHDLGKYGQCDGREHGRHSVDQKWDLFGELWDKYLLSDIERQQIKSAVICHSGGRVYEGYALDYVINKILHTADALDRARFHRHGRLDWNCIEHPQLKVENDHPSLQLRKLIAESEAICSFTNYRESYPSFREFISYIR